MSAAPFIGWRILHRLKHRHPLVVGESSHGYAYVWADCVTCGRSYVVALLRVWTIR